MAEHHGPDGPDPMRAAAVDDAAQALLSAWDAAREQATPRLSGPSSAPCSSSSGRGHQPARLAGELKMMLSSASRLCDRLVASAWSNGCPAGPTAARSRCT
jgi:hypothetical protein